ncbi:hypothetical protein AB0383_16310 [Amycolatopsis sp. NPDC051373]|uniref:hypothetical protein n=1 Tax=Amycolatopsis sp. NPDC051373 TaxID=3155801 RepID=UPI00344D21CB
MSWEIDLVERRRTRTGESFQKAKDQLIAGASGLSADERSDLRTLATATMMPAPFGPEVDVPPAVRNAALPDAATNAQIELESGVLDAVTRAVNHLHTHPEGGLTRPAVVLQSVTPLRDRLQIRVDPIAVAPLLYEILPSEFEGEVSGVKGLRVRLHRRSMELFLIDFPDAVVELVGTARQAWHAAEAYRAVRNRDELATDVRLYRAAPDTLTQVETQALDSYGRAFGPAEVASGLLRRIALLRDALWIRTWPTGCAHFNVEWPGDNPRRSEAALALADPLFGLPGAEIETQAMMQIPARRVSCGHGDQCNTHHLRFRFTELPDSNQSGSALSALQAYARPEWDAWQRALGKSTE